MYSTVTTFLGVVFDLVLVLTLFSVFALFERKDRPKLVRVVFSLVMPTSTFTSFGRLISPNTECFNDILDLYLLTDLELFSGHF